jgi:hypothetical protein
MAVRSDPDVGRDCQAPPSDCPDIPDWRYGDMAAAVSGPDPDRTAGALP